MTVPLIRDDSSTKGTDEGLREATWDEALELVSSKLKETWKNDKNRLAFWGSGQQPITEGYCTAKFWKAGLLSNNIDPNARLCMASAVVGFMNVFQTDEPAGCYEGFRQRRRVRYLGREHGRSTSDALLAPDCPQALRRGGQALRLGHHQNPHERERRQDHALQAPTPIWPSPTCIANYLVQNKLYDEAFVNDHLQFKQGTENIGNATNDGYDASDVGKTVDDVAPITFDEFAARLAPYTFEYTSELSGVPVEDLEELAKVFADKDAKVMSLWTMGVNQHNRGTWMNHNLYNIHLLSGKIAKPGCGPFSLTGQPPLVERRARWARSRTVYRPTSW